MLVVVGLAEKAEELISSLPYEYQRLVEIARALATEPDLLLLDEPAAGMNPMETRRLAETITSLNHDRGITILLVEHDMKLVMSICPRLIVINNGSLLATGSPAEISGNEDVIAAYLGQGGQKSAAGEGA